MIFRKLCYTPSPLSNQLLKSLRGGVVYLDRYGGTVLLSLCNLLHQLCPETILFCKLLVRGAYMMHGHCSRMIFGLLTQGVNSLHPCVFICDSHVCRLNLFEQIMRRA